MLFDVSSILLQQVYFERRVGLRKLLRLERAFHAPRILRCDVHGVKLGSDEGNREVVRLIADSYPLLIKYFEGENKGICSCIMRLAGKSLE